MEEQLLDAKDIRILWNINKEGKISELTVVKFSELEDPSIKDCHEAWPLHLYKHFKLDTGNCMAGWNKNVKANLLAEIFNLFISYGFENNDVINAAFREFRKIDQIKDVIDRVFSPKIGLGSEGYEIEL